MARVPFEGKLDEETVAPFTGKLDGEGGGLLDRLASGGKDTFDYGRLTLTGGPEDAAKIVNEINQRKAGPTPDQIAIAKAVEPYNEAAKKAEGWDKIPAWGSLIGEAAKQYVTHPKEALGMVLENLPNSAPGMAAGLGGGVAGGAVAGPPGAVAGGLLGGFGGGFAVERGSSIYDQAMDAAKERGIDPKDPAKMSALISEIYPEISDKANVKGAVTAGTDSAFNVLTLGLAGAGERTLKRTADQIVKNVERGAITRAEGDAAQAAVAAERAANNTLGAKALRGAGITAGEMVGESASEGLGQYFGYGKVDPYEVVQEGLLAPGQGGVMAAGHKAADKALGTGPGMGEVDASIAQAKAALSAPSGADLDAANAAVGAEMGNYETQVPATTPLLTHNPDVAIPMPGTLADAAATAVEASGPVDTSAMLLRNYPTQQAAEAELNSKEDPELYSIISHPRGQSGFAVVPKPPAEVVQIMSTRNATQQSEARNAQVAQEEESSKRQTETRKSIMDLFKQASSLEKSINETTPAADAANIRMQASELRQEAAKLHENLKTAAAEQTLTQSATAPATAAENTAQATQQEAAQSELVPAAAQPVSSMPGVQRTTQQRVATATQQAETRNAQVAQEEAGVEAALGKVNTAPSDAQKAAGNYAKGHVKIGGLDIAIENPSGSSRSGVENGKKWTSTMSAHYGYVKRTEGNDGDQVDVYVKPGTATTHEGPVFVVDQYNPKTKQFDEHKALIGYGSQAEAAAAYDAHFSDGTGPKRRQAVTKMALPVFKQWLQAADMAQPAVASDRAQTEINQSTGKASRRRGNETAGEYHARMAAESNQRKAAHKGARVMPARSDDETALRENLGDAEATVVGQRDLPDSDVAGRGEVSRQNAEFISHIARLFKKRVVFYSSPNSTVEGIYRNGDRVFINTKSNVAQLRLLGHELVHAMKQQAPDAYARMLGALQNLITDDQMLAQYKDYFGTALDDTSKLDAPFKGEPSLRDFLTEEWLADLSGNRFAEESFWSGLFAEIESQHGRAAKGIIARLRMAISNAINKLLQVMRGGKFSVDARMAEHLEQVRDAVKQGFVEYEKAAKAGHLQGGGSSEAKFARGTADQTLPTRWPKSKKATNSVNDPLLADLETLRSTPDQLEKAVNAIVEEPGMKVRGRTVEAKLEGILDKMVSNLLWLHDQVAPGIRQRSKRWYDGARSIAEKWSEKYDITESQAAGVLAVLSPQKDWFMNVTMAERVLDILSTKEGHKFDAKMKGAAFQFLVKELNKPEEKRKNLDAFNSIKEKTLREVIEVGDLRATGIWLRAYDEAYHDPRHSVIHPEGDFGSNAKTYTGTETLRAWGDFNALGKAASVYLNGSAENINAMLGGEHKVRNFYNNIYAPKDSRFATVDTHAVAADLLRPLAGADKPVADNFGKSGGSDITGVSGTYPIHLEAYKRAAAERGLLPREMQSITWEAVRGLFTEGFKGKKGNLAAIDAVWTQVDKGKLTVEQAREKIVEMASGFEHPDWWNGQEPAMQGAEKSYEQNRPAFQGNKIAFEVAPDPNNKALTKRWNSLPEKEKAEISYEMAWDVASRVLAHYNNDTVKGELHTQVGGYLNDTNPSFSLWMYKYASMSKVQEIARVLGYVLTQDSMVIGAPTKFKGGTEMGYVRVTNVRDSEAKAVYDELRANILAQDGSHLINGHTTAEGSMVILVPKDARTGIAEAVAAHLGDRHDVASGTTFVQWPERGEDDYGLSRGRETGRSGAEPSVRAFAHNLRAETAAELERRIAAASGKRSTERSDVARDERDGGLAAEGSRDVPEYGERKEGSASVIGQHWSKEPRPRLIGSYYGTGLSGAERPRVMAAKDRRLRSRIYFYVHGEGDRTTVAPEAGVGAVRHDVRLNNLYDARVRSDIQKQINTAEVDGWPVQRGTNEWSNLFESAVIDAGYDGYISPFGDQYAAVLLGDHVVETGVKRSTARKGTELAHAFRSIFDRESMFRHNESYADDPVQIAKDIAPALLISKMASWAPAGSEEAWQIGVPIKSLNGRTQYEDAYLSADENSVWLNTAALEEGSRGSAVYSIAGNFARNTGRVFIGDPEGITLAGMRRRIEHMMSQALKFGTTEFMAPHPKQLDKFKEHGLEWAEGDHDKNLHSLITASYNYVTQLLPEIKDVELDLATGQFRRISTGENYTDADFERAASSLRGNGRPLDAAGAPGSGTLKVAAFTNTLLRESDRGGWGQVLDRLGVAGAAGVRASLAKTRFSALREDVLDDAPLYQALDGARLEALRGAAARLERPEKGLFLRVTPEGRAIATGQKGQRVPPPFIKFAKDNGLTFSAERRLPQYQDGAYTAGGNRFGGAQTEPMPFEYRKGGAMYFGEIGGEALDRTGMSRFSTARAQTDTPEFKKWFGNSKIRDENGEPMRMYHITPHDFATFHPGGKQVLDGHPEGLSGRAIWFSPNKEDQPAAHNTRTRSGYQPGTNVMPVYLRIERPLLIDTETMMEWARNVYSEGSSLFPQIMPSKVVEAVKGDGYDGIVFKGKDLGWGQNGDEYIAFDPTQIKSAIGNNGQFDGSNPDIRYSTKREETPVFYSQLARQVEAAPERMFSTAPQFKLWLNNNAPKLGIKKDEIQWSGVNEYLDTLGKGKVSKADVLAYLEQGGVKVQEVMKGTPTEEFIAANRAYRQSIKDDAPESVQDELKAKADALRYGQEKYSKWQLPGGEDYRELLLTLPGRNDAEIQAKRDELVKIQDDAYKAAFGPRNLTPEEVDRINELRMQINELGNKQLQGKFHSSHWDEPNILAHIRYNDRTDADGAKVLFIEEIQSDWGQKGREEGFADPNSPVYAVFAKPGAFLKSFERKEEADSFAASVDGVVREEKRQPGDDSRPPSAPFVTDTKSWVSLAVKRMIAHAAQNGYDKVAFVTGEQSADRYDLSKQIEVVEYQPAGEGRWDVRANKPGGEEVFREDGINAGRIEEVVGKDVAEKIVNDNGKSAGYPGTQWKELSGLDLKVGGEGMKSFYDRIVPQVVNDVLKKVGGGRVEGVRLSDSSLNTKQGAEDDALLADLGVEVEGKRPLEQPGFTITPVMKEKVAGGLPLFSPNRSTLGTLTPGQLAAANNILGTPKTFGERLADFKKDWQKNLVQGIFDQFAPLKDLDPHAYIQARLSKGGDSTLEALMLYGKLKLGQDGATDVIYTKAGGMQGFASKMAALKGEHDRFLLWVAAQRADRLKAIGLENLWSATDIAELSTLDQGNMADGTARAGLYEQALRDLNEFNDNILEIAEKSGLVDAETRKLYKDTPYVPFYRLQEDDSVKGFGVKAGLVNQYAWKKLKGGTEKLNEDLLANLLHNWSHLITASAKNRAAKAALDAAVDAEVAVQVPSGAPGKGHVSYKEGGVEKSFVVTDPHVMEAIVALEYAGIGPWAKPFVTAKHWLTVGVTANPAFKVRNLIRDSVSAIGSSSLSYNPAKNLGQGWGATAKDAETRAHMLAAGGMIRFGSMLDGKDSQRAQDLIKQGVDPEMILDSDGKILRFWKTKVHPALAAYQELGDRGEQINRAALYEQLVAKGMSHGEAAFWARDLMDFSMSGKWAAIRGLTQLVPFMNARLQGLYKLGRAANENPKKMGYTVAAVGLFSLALLLAAKGDPDDWKDWQARSESDRNNNWWFKVGGIAYRIPKPFEIGAIGTIAERGFELMTDNEMTGKRFGTVMRDIVMSQLSMNPTPQLIKPMADIYANKDAFTGRDIESMGMSRLRKQDRYDEKTSEVAKFLGRLGLPDPTQLAMGRWDELSPKQIDYLARGYFSWLGTATTTALDYGIRPMLDRGARPERPLRDVFFVGNFAETLPANGSRYLTQMYDQAKEIEEAYSSWKARLKVGDVAGANAIRESEREKIVRYHQVEALKRQESLVNVQIRRVEASTSLNGEEKRQRLDDLYQRRNLIAQRFRAS